MIVNDAELVVRCGEVVGLMGPSGCGKTTLGRLVAGLLEPTNGTVEIDGAPVPTSGVAPVQIILQHPELAVDPRWTLRRILAEAGDPDADLLDEFSISDSWLERFPNELSGGELQRVAVARALLADVPFLVADEISAMLDPITQAQLWQALRSRVAAGRIGILAISHDAALLAQVADRVLDARVLLGATASATPNT
jgi:peptide/nickel transport system ATP-binding protein